MYNVTHGFCPHSGTDSQHEHIVHCVSADGKMGAGFAAHVPYQHKCLFRQHVDTNYNNWTEAIGQCIITIGENETYAHLVTKERHWHKPTINTLQAALNSFIAENKALGEGINWKSPLIGCGLDRLPQAKVIPMIEATIETIGCSTWEVFIPKYNN